MQTEKQEQTGAVNKALMDAINIVHMGNFNQIFRNFEENQNQKKKVEKSEPIATTKNTTKSQNITRDGRNHTKVLEIK